MAKGSSGRDAPGAPWQGSVPAPGSGDCGPTDPGNPHLPHTLLMANTMSSYTERKKGNVPL